jgi:hypothetical protein
VPLTHCTTISQSRCISRKHRHNLTRPGVRKKKLEIVQLWRCSSCKLVFTPGPAALRDRTYPLRLILAALCDYDLGYSFETTAARLRKKTGRHVSPSTITSWLHEYQEHCAYLRLRGDGLKSFPPEQTIRSIKLYHRQVYGYAYHPGTGVGPRWNTR